MPLLRSLNPEGRRLLQRFRPTWGSASLLLPYPRQPATCRQYQQKVEGTNIYQFSRRRRVILECAMEELIQIGASEIAIEHERGTGNLRRRNLRIEDDYA